jgi:catechol 2,3-dioxygenase-like lactoylglutathione lyase family enzyme
MNVYTLMLVHRLPVVEDDPVSRVQLALNVSNIEEAVDFYSKLFQVEPAKRRDGYANFAVDSPPLKLVLIENPTAAGSLNHLGVEVFSTSEVAAAQARLAGEGMATASEENVTCCYALQHKVWADDPDGAPWEIYTVLADSDTPAGELRTVDVCGAGACGPTELAGDESRQASVSGCC